MDTSEFENLVDEAIESLPPHIKAKLDNVAVVIEDEPTAEQLKKGHTRAGDLLLGLYEGIPRTQRGPGYTWVLPDKITVFKKAIESSVGVNSAERVREAVRHTVWHEVAHHFGFDEDSVQKLARRRKS